MALDGLFLFRLTAELNEELLDTRVEKIYQPSKEELVFVMRSRQGAKKLYVNARADGARVHLTEQNFINPSNPPMLCMLLRKKFTSARLENITQNSLERILVFHFTALNDFGDRVGLQMVCEIMGRYSNVIFTDENGLIVDALKRVGSNKSSVREILPGLRYQLPPSQDKLSLLECANDQISARLEQNRNSLLSKALLKSLQGVSPLRCTELVFLAYGEDAPVYEINDGFAALLRQTDALRLFLHEKTTPCIIFDGEKQIGFSFTDILQFGETCRKEYFDSLSDVLDKFYTNRLAVVKRSASGGELLKKTASVSDRILRRVSLQKKELEECEDCEQLKIFGELIHANLFELKENCSQYHVFNYYTGEMIDIPADILLTPAQNAAKYYKEYRKKQNAKIYLKEQIQKGEEELEYLESVADILERAETPDDIAAVKFELITQGFLKAKLNKREKNPKQMKPLRFETSGGFTVAVGRNNLMNDKLTFKDAKGGDIWLHAKNIHGSHAILFSDGKEVPEEDLIEAAALAAYYSKSGVGKNIPVDYTFAKFVKRQPSKIPGRVFYTDYKTVYVSPEKVSIEKMKR